jgi:hypothetical protein
MVERTTRFLLLVALPNGKRSDLVADALAAKITTLPAALTRTLTWDQGHEMAEHARFTIDTGIQVYFCDPKSHPGSAAATRTSTDCCANTCPAAATCITTARPTSTPSPTNSTADLDRRSASGHHPKH